MTPDDAIEFALRGTEEESLVCYSSQLSFQASFNKSDRRHVGRGRRDLFGAPDPDRLVQVLA